MSNTPDLEALFAHHKKAVLAFSGGKDSLTCLHLCRDYRDKIDVCWVNTGAAFPHMMEFVRKATEGFNFVELKSDQAGWIGQFGYPADLMPILNSTWGSTCEIRRPMIQPWSVCCAKLRLHPVLDYLRRSGATLFIHGQRRSDGGGFTCDSIPDATVEICKLLWEWSDRDVMDYIGHHGIDLPEHYAQGVDDSLDCWNCTARGGDPIALKKAKGAYMAKRYPDLFEEWKLLMGKVFVAIKATFDEVKADTAYAWHGVAEEAETDGAAPGPVPKCAPERGAPGHDLVDHRARP